MKFDENLRIIRKQKGLSQEQLASQLEVSRQAVSKWESGNGYPEMDKLIQISEILECSIDDLLKKEIIEEDIEIESKIINPKFHKLFDDHYNTFAKMMSAGVVTILIAVTLYLELEIILLEEHIANAIFIGLISIAVFIFIYFGYQHGVFEKAYTNKTTQYSAYEITKFNHRFALMIGIGVCIILLGIILTSLFEYEAIGNVFFMCCICIGVGIFVYYGIQKSKFTASENHDEAKKIRDKKNEKYSSIIMLSATIIFFILGFILNQWRYCWIVFPIGGILCGIVEEINK